MIEKAKVEDDAPYVLLRIGLPDLVEPEASIEATFLVDDARELARMLVEAADALEEAGLS